MNYWHMQMHPDDKSFSDENVYFILEHKKIIGLGDWVEGESVIYKFHNHMKVNDIVAIKSGARLIALVQVIGGGYSVDDDNTTIGWIKNRRPIRVLDWELGDKKLPQPRGTLEICANDEAKTTRVICDWHEKVINSFEKRKLPIQV